MTGIKDWESILVERKGRVGIITLNRPDYLNAVNATMGREIREQIEDFNNDKEIGSIVITGAGRAFCSGADVSGFEATVRGESGSVDDQIDRFPKWPIFIRGSKPVICALNGYAIGLGITMPMGCDIRVMAENARISFRFAYIGLTPEYASTHLLAQTVGIGKAMEFMLTGRFIESGEALETGLVNHVYPDNELMERAVDLAGLIAFNPTWQLAEIKRMVREHQFLDDPSRVMEMESEIFSKSQQTPAHKEFLKSFREKREPDYHGFNSEKN